MANVQPYYRYDESGNKTTDVEGYRYDIVLPDVGYEKVSVKIPGERQLDDSAIGTLVELNDLDIKVYVIRGELMITIKASKIVKAKG